MITSKNGTDKETLTFVSQTKAVEKAKEKAEKESKPKKKTFALNIPLDRYVYITDLISKKAKEGHYNYSLKDAFAEGLQLLKKDNPLISSESLGRRFYKGGDQKSKIETYRSSSQLFASDINWIDNLILERRRENEFYSKSDFINELVDNLKKSYKD